MNEKEKVAIPFFRELAIIKSRGLAAYAAGVIADSASAIRSAGIDRLERDFTEVISKIAELESKILDVQRKGC